MKQIHLFSLQRYIFLFIQQEMKQKIMLFTSRNEANNIFEKQKSLFISIFLLFYKIRLLLYIFLDNDSILF